MRISFLLCNRTVLISFTKNKNIIFGGLGTLVAAGILLLDIALPLGVADGVLYIALVLIAFFSKNKNLIYIGAITGTSLTIAGFFISPPGSEPWQVIANRSLIIFTIWAVTILCLLQHNHSEKMKTVIGHLEKKFQQRTIELNKSNSQLTRESTYVQLHKDIAIASNETRALKDTLKVCLEKVCIQAGWPVGHAYLLQDQDSKILVSTKSWYLEDPKSFKVFQKISELTPFISGSGLPGRVLESGQPEWVIDVTKDSNFPRSKMAANIGVKAGFAFPLLIGPSVVGVMEFFSSNPAQPDTDMMEVMAEVGIQLGRAVERKWAEEDIQSSHEQLRKLYQRFEMIREEERTRIAREVHDELAQTLTTLKLELSLLDKKMVGENTLLHKDIQMMLELINNTIHTVKKIGMELRPPILDDLGIYEAITWQGREFEKRTGIHFDFDVCFENIELDIERSTTIFRIFQETLTNIVRHSKAKNIYASIREENSTVTLEIKDDGVGIKSEQISNIRSLGLRGMRERALVWGGNVDITGVHKQGTTVIINIKK